MKTGTIILFRLVIWFRNVNLHKENKIFMAYINIRVNWIRVMKIPYLSVKYSKLMAFLEKLFEEPTIQCGTGT